MKVVLGRLRICEQEEAPIWGRLKTPVQRLNNYSFGLRWLLIDFIVGVCMCGLLIRVAGVGKFSPGFCLGMDVAFCVGHWHVISKVWW